MYLESNLNYFKEYNLNLIQEINLVSSEDIESIKVNNDIIFKLADDTGNEFFTGSVYDPHYEAKTFLEDVNFDNTGYLVMGLNSSSLITEILKKKTDTAWVFVIEKDLKVIKKFLEEVDLSPFLDGRSERLVFFYGEENYITTYLQQFLFSLVGYYFLQAEWLRTFPTLRLNTQYYDAVTHFITDAIRNHVFNLGNDLDDTLMGIRNELKNLKHIVKQPQLKEFKKKFEGVPIICVASGPSLDKQLPLLKEAKGKCIIISAESAFKVLIKNGIAPDIVCVLERGKNSYDLSFKDVDIPEETALFGLTIIEPLIYDYWHKYKVPNFKENLVNSHFLNEALGNFGEYYSGNSVAHMCYMLASYLGGSPIVFIGQDLAFSEEGTTHSKDSIYNLNAQDSMNENTKNLIKTSLENTTLVHNREVWLDGYYGKKVKSRELWRQFLFWMEHLVAISNSPTINATEGGVDIKGTQKMPFAEVIEQYCNKPVNNITTVFDSVYEGYSDNTIKIPEYMSKVFSSFDNLKKEVDEISEYAKENLISLDSLLDDIKSQRHDNLEVKASRILRNNEYIIRTVLSTSLIEFFLRPLIANLHVKVNPISRIISLERLVTILDMQREFLDSVIKAGKKFIETYENGLKGTLEDLGLNKEDLILEESLNEQ